MAVTYAQSPQSARALALVTSLQARFRQQLEGWSARRGHADRFQAVQWLRDDGRHGGGTRFEIGDTALFNRGSINVSQVHYDDDPARKLSSATALSTIIHPQHPRSPSVHIHLSWTEMRTGHGTWRLMADLNPAIEDNADAQRFADALAAASGDRFDDGQRQGNQYFFIPALGRHRGVFHFYLEGYSTLDVDADDAFALQIGEAAIDTYTAILTGKGEHASEASAAEREAQRRYHTLYLYQVLTLDRGTTSGLLIHDQNDRGILGSLPAVVDRDLLASWRNQAPPPQDALVDAIVDVLPVDGAVTTEVKQRLAHALRSHYRTFPEALALQASGDIIPPTVDNHRPVRGDA